MEDGAVAMEQPIAIVGTGCAAGAALERLVRARPSLRLAFAGERGTADEIVAALDAALDDADRAAGGADPVRTTSRGADPVRTTSRGADPVRTTSRGADPVRTSSRGVDPARMNRRDTDPVRTSSRDADLSHGSSSGVDPARRSSNDADPVRTSSRGVDSAARGAACLLLPEGESRELARALVARGVRVVDAGADLRLSLQAGSVFGLPGSSAQRLLALPSAGAMAAWLAVAPLVEANLLHPDRLAVLLLAASAPDLAQPWAQPASLALQPESTRIAGELSWLFEQRRWPPQRVTCAVVRVPGASGLLAVVQGDVACAEGGELARLRAALDPASRDGSTSTGREPARDEPGPRDNPAVARDAPASRGHPLFAGRGSTARIRLCDEGEWPDAARVAGQAFAEVAVAVDSFAERITCSCALDPAAFVAAVALDALLARSPA